MNVIFKFNSVNVNVWYIFSVYSKYITSLFIRDDDTSTCSWLSDFSQGRNEAEIYIISNIQTNNIWLERETCFGFLICLLLKVFQNVVANSMWPLSCLMMSQLLMTFFEGWQVLITVDIFHSLDISGLTNFYSDF